MNVKLNQWLAFIDDEDERLIELAEKKNEVIKEAGVEVRRYTEDEQAKYMATLMEMWESDRASEMWDAREEGLKQRIRTAVQNNGILKGTNQTKNEIAKKMKKEKVDTQIIAKTTGLSKEEIEKL